MLRGAFLVKKSKFSGRKITILGSIILEANEIMPCGKSVI
jgi:hypothetical protein